MSDPLVYVLDRGTPVSAQVAARLSLRLVRRPTDDGAALVVVVESDDDVRQLLAHRDLRSLLSVVIAWALPEASLAALLEGIAEIPVLIGLPSRDELLAAVEHRAVPYDLSAERAWTYRLAVLEDLLARPRRAASRGRGLAHPAATSGPDDAPGAATTSPLERRPPGAQASARRPKRPVGGWPARRQGSEGATTRKRATS